MATSTSSVNSGPEFSARPALRTRPTGNGLTGPSGTPRSPRTPLLGRSISSQFGSPGSSFRAEQEELIVYELGARHLSAGFAGESHPRCVVNWTPDIGGRVGDYRSLGQKYTPRRRRACAETSNGDHEFYRLDGRSLDLGLAEDKLERTLRRIHSEFLQLDSKPRKAVLVIPSLLPTPVLEIMLKLLFNHFTQPPLITMLTTPMLACVGAGQRNALVVDIGWEESVVTAIGEYKQVHQRRSVRAGKMLVLEMAQMVESRVKDSMVRVDTATAEDLIERVAWCRPLRGGDEADRSREVIQIPLSDRPSLTLPYGCLSDPVESVFFPVASSDSDDHDLSLPALAYRVLLALPPDLRASTMSRIVITGGVSQLPGLKHRLLQELAHLSSDRSWDPVHNYGSASAHHERALKDRIGKVPSRPVTADSELSVSSTGNSTQSSVPHGERVHDDVRDPTSIKAEGRVADSKAHPETVKGVVRGVETVGAWAAASMIASLRIKGVHEVEREDFSKHGLKEALI